MGDGMDPNDTYTPAHLKIQCELLKVRIETRNNKKTNTQKTLKKEIEQCLRDENTREATEKTERYIMIESQRNAEKLLECPCNYVALRVSSLGPRKEMKGGLKTMLYTLVWASQRVNLPELLWIKQAVTVWHGNELSQYIIENRGEDVSEEVILRLDMSPITHEDIAVFLDIMCKELDIPTISHTKEATESIEFYTRKHKEPSEEEPSEGEDDEWNIEPGGYEDYIYITDDVITSVVKDNAET